MNMQALLKQAQKMQKELGKAESELKEKLYETTMGGGAVKVVCKGSMEVQSIEIAEDLLNKEGKEDLQEMLLSAMNETLEKIVKEKEQTMNSLTGGVKMPGGF